MNEIIEKWCKLPDCDVEYEKCTDEEKSGYLISNGEVPFMKFMELAMSDKSIGVVELKNGHSNRSYFCIRTHSEIGF